MVWARRMQSGMPASPISYQPPCGALMGPGRRHPPQVGSVEYKTIPIRTTAQSSSCNSASAMNGLGQWGPARACSRVCRLGGTQVRGEQAYAMVGGDVPPCSTTRNERMQQAHISARRVVMPLRVHGWQALGSTGKRNRWVVRPVKDNPIESAGGMGRAVGGPRARYLHSGRTPS